MAKQQKNYQTQWAGQFGVAHELTRRGYLVTFTTGNAPAADLLCVSPNGVSFRLQVKSIAAHNSWICQQSLIDKSDLYFAFVVVPAVEADKPVKPVEYFLLSHAQFMQVVDRQKQWMAEREKVRGKPYKEFAATGFNYPVLANYFNHLNAWHNLPA